MTDIEVVPSVGSVTYEKRVASINAVYRWRGFKELFDKRIIIPMRGHNPMRMLFENNNVYLEGFS